MGWEETGLSLAFPGSIYLILPTKSITYDDVGHWGRTERRYYLNWSENGAAPNSKKFLNCTKLHHSPWQVSRIGGRCQVNPTKTPALFPLVWAPKLPGAARSLMGESKNGLLTSSYSHLTRDIWVHLRKHCIPKVSQSDGGIQCGNWASAKHVIPATRG